METSISLAHYLDQHTATYLYTPLRAAALSLKMSSTLRAGLFGDAEITGKQLLSIHQPENQFRSWDPNVCRDMRQLVSILIQVNKSEEAVDLAAIVLDISVFHSQNIQILDSQLFLALALSSASRFDEA